MDGTTRAVRDMYEQYPYPAQVPVLRAGTDARLLLSYVSRRREGEAPLRVLDAGCGRGSGVLACAGLQPDVHFTAVDINRVGLKELAAEAERRELSNLTVAEVDLMTMEGLEVPPEGFDVIISSGVLHHMSDPQAALCRLRDALAPHGVMALQLYGRFGREPLYRLRDSLQLLLPADLPLGDKVEPARLLAQQLSDKVLKNTPWQDTADMVDVEFVDRVLNVHETSYDIDSLWELLRNASMQFIRWTEPQHWSVQEVFADSDLLPRARELSEQDQFRLIERSCWRPSLELVVALRQNGPRAPLDPSELDKTLFAVSPEAKFLMDTRNLRGEYRIERAALQVRNRHPLELEGDPLTAAFLLLREQNLPFSGDSFIEALAEDGISIDDAHTVLEALTDLELLYRPHPTEV